MPSKLTKRLMCHLRAGGRMGARCTSDILGSKFRTESFVAMPFQSEQSANNFNLAPLANGQSLAHLHLSYHASP